MNLFIIIIYIIYIIASSSIAHALANNDNMKPDIKPFILYEDGLIDAVIDDATIREVLNEFKIKTGLQIYVNDPSITNMTISMKLNNFSLEKSIKIVLDGFSYVLYSIDERLVLILLSTNINKKNIHHKVSSIIKLTTNNNAGIPQSLDEFRMVTMEQFPANSMMEGQGITEPDGEQISHKKYNEALLNRALDVINSSYDHLHQEAIDQLVGLDDHRATEVLVNATEIGNGYISRVQAVETLSRHAINLQFSDTSIVEVLRQLAEDNDESISKLARETLSEEQSQ